MADSTSSKDPLTGNNANESEPNSLLAAKETTEGGETDAMDGPLPENITGQTYMTLNGEEVCGTERDLDENAYGCAAVALVRESTKLALELRRGTPYPLTLLRLCASLGLMAVNLVLQFTILRYISSYVVEPAVRDVQLKYSHFHANVFHEDGSLNDEAWGSYAYKNDICEITMADSTFYYLVLLLWTLRILEELRKIHHFLEEILSIKTCAKAEEQLEFTDTGNPELGGRCLITSLTCTMKTLLIALVALPRLVIAGYLLVLGCRWLSASANFGDMVLNALALVFVTDIDEILYDSILPAALKKQIADTNWFFIEADKNKNEVEQDEWRMYRITAIWLTLVAVFLFIYGFIYQSVLPFGVADIAAHCKELQNMMETPLCDKMSWMGLNKDCYPFGSIVSAATLTP
jgi:hypothetical protein